ncbi:MAG: hypothetical protein ACOVRN_07455 [Flavobacterium sp.]
MSVNVITGEKIQQMCDIYIGKQSDFEGNPVFKHASTKQVNIEHITTPIHNPFYVFCYGHVIHELSTKIHYFINPCILITHNSDQNITPTPEIMNILNNDKVIKWYSQNIAFYHTKLYLLPIGLANRMWAHGNLSIFDDSVFLQNSHIKSNDVYFHFNIQTNIGKRQPCFNTLHLKYPWLAPTNPHDNLRRLNTYRFCICPEGNGIDTHRLWECLYLRVVPIMIQSPFTDILSTYHVPMVIIQDWRELLTMELNYDDYSFDDDTFQSILLFPKIAQTIFNITYTI